MKDRFFNLWLFGVAIIFVLLLFLFSPIFTIDSIEIIGNNRVAEGTIKELTGLEKPRNIFSYNTRKAKKDLLENTYIEDVKFNKVFFTSNLTLEITERNLSGYIEYVPGSYIYINEDGYVLEVSSSYSEKLPVVTGLKFSEFTVGKILEVENKKSFHNLVTLSHLFKKYDMDTDIIRVELNEAEDIHIYIKQIDVFFGDISGADEKIRTIKETVKEIDNKFENKKGSLFIQDISKPPVFRLLT